MHRQPLLDQLAVYAARHPDETETVGRFILSDESHDLRWLPLDEVPALTTEDSMTRMVRKTLGAVVS